MLLYLIKFSENYYIIECYKARHSKKLEGKKKKKKKKKPFAYNWFQQQKKRSAQTRNRKVQQRVGHRQSHLIGVQLNSNLRNKGFFQFYRRQNCFPSAAFTSLKWLEVASCEVLKDLKAKSEYIASVSSANL